MPQLTVRGIDAGLMRRISTAMLRELGEICECSQDNFTLDCLEVRSAFGDQIVATYPFIEVAWFDRGGAVRDKVAEAITRHILQGDIGVPEVEIAFKVYLPDAYYINGKPCT
jgi:hypothetical protein